VVLREVLLYHKIANCFSSLYLNIIGGQILVLNVHIIKIKDTIL